MTSATVNLDLTVGEIGASEAAAILGISPFSDRLDVFARHHGLSGPEEQTEEQFWGTTLEPLLVGVFAVRMNLPTQYWNQPIYSKKHPWRRASPDAFVLDKNGNRIAVIEIKTAGHYRASEWDPNSRNAEGAPDYYVVQVNQELGVSELDHGYLVVLLGGNDFRIYEIPYDAVLDEIIIAEEKDFRREHLLPKIAPSIDGSKSAREYLARRYPREKEKLRPATAAEVVLLEEYAHVYAEAKSLEARKAELENRLKSSIAEAEGLEWANGSGRLTWKKTRDRMETNWEKLAMSQLEGYAPDEKAALLEQYTHVAHGARRMLLRYREQEAE